MSLSPVSWWALSCVKSFSHVWAAKLPQWYLSIEGLQHCERVNAYQIFKIVNLFSHGSPSRHRWPYSAFWHTESKVLHLYGRVLGRDTKRLAKSLPLTKNVDKNRWNKTLRPFSEYFKTEQTTDSIRAATRMVVVNSNSIFLNLHDGTRILHKFYISKRSRRSP